jgi:outer membrane biosynthesis protein TonB
VSAYALPLDISWAGGSEEDRRYRRILAITALFGLLLSLVVTLLPVPKVERSTVEDVPKRIARLVLEQRRPAPPPPPPPVTEQAKPEAKPEPKPEAKAEAKPQPKPENRTAARERAARSGIMAFSNDLAELRDDRNVALLESPQRLSKAGQTATGDTKRSILTSKATSGSGGINTAGLSRDTGTTRLATRSTEKVDRPVEAGASAADAARATGKAGGRSDEEIQLMFDRNKAAINNIYNRALRANPTLRGKVVFRLTIAPSGELTRVEVVSSELRDAALERKLVLHIKRITFAAKDVAATTLNYTMDFFPS